MRSRNLLALLTAALPVHAAIPLIPGFKLTWADDFSGPAYTLPNLLNWIIDNGTSYPNGPENWGTGEIQTYTADICNLRLTGEGSLQITPLLTRGQWTSARIETVRSDFQALPGKKMRIQSRMIMPDVHGSAALGYWAAFWTLGSNYRGDTSNWPSVGEFDIMENVNGINRVWGVLHCGTNPGGPCNEPSGLGNNLECRDSPCQGNWHEYTLEVDRSCGYPEIARWFVDGVQFHEVNQTQVGNETWAQAVQHGHFVLLNLAMGGSFPNAVLGGNTPLENVTVDGRPMFVDYVAVYND